MASILSDAPEREADIHCKCITLQVVQLDMDIMNVFFGLEWFPSAKWMYL